MRELVKRIGSYTIEVRGKPYEALLRAILYQQLAGPAAAAIERRFLALYDGAIPTPAELATATDEALRAAGISRQKASYMRSIGEHFASGQISRPQAPARRRRRCDRAGDADKGHRPLDRGHAPDVLPRPGRRAAGGRSRRAERDELAYGLKALPKPAEMEAIAEPWRPYRSAAAGISGGAAISSRCDVRGVGGRVRSDGGSSHRRSAAPFRRAHRECGVRRRGVRIPRITSALGRRAARHARRLSRYPAAEARSGVQHDAAGYDRDLQQTAAETSASDDDLSDRIRHVVRHEIAHYFGISDERLREIDAY